MLFLRHKTINNMLGFDSKREIITGEFARRIWNEVLALWHRDKVAHTEDRAQEFEVIWQ